MRSWIFLSGCFLLASQIVPVPEDRLTSQEASFLRRQAEFWKDRDYSLMKRQITEFLSSRKMSSIHSNLHAMMGDILYQEGHYADAIVHYEQVNEEGLKEKIAHRRWQCLYLEGEYDQIIQGIDSADPHQEMQFILADSLFRKMRQTPDVALALRAKPLFLDLFNTSYRGKVLLPLAEVHRELKEFQEAAALYLILAEGGSREEFLLQAAALQLEFDSLQATSTFAQLVDFGGERASDAAYHEMLLLFQNEKFSDLIERAPKLEVLLDKDRRDQLDFCLGRSYFKMDRISEAVPHLAGFIEKESENTAYKKAAFSMLIQCAKETENEDLFSSTLDQFLTAFSGDEEAGKALLLHAQMAAQQENFLQASRDLTQLVHNFPEFPDQEALLYDQAVLLCKAEEWRASREAFLVYLEKFPQTPHRAVIHSSLVHCSTQEVKNGSGSKEQLIADLKLEKNDSYQFLLGQLLFELGRFEESFSELDQFCQKNPNHPEAQFLQALALREMGSEMRQFIPAAERVLDILEEPHHREVMQLHLFNAYLSFKDYEKAASILYQTFIVERGSIQQENQLWLAHYYLEKEPEKSIEIFNKIFNKSDAVHFDPSQIHLEAEMLIFVSLFSPAERVQYLTGLIELQKEHSHLAWKNQSNALFDLAKAFVELNQTEKALDILEEVISQDSPTVILNAALLEKSRLLLAQDQTESSLQFVLSTLKDLQIQKDLGAEPIHLEAAFTYADVRIALATAEMQTESALFFLNRIKEDFADLQYTEARLRFPEKDELFQIYMQCLEAEILYWESKSALEIGDGEKAKHQNQVATSLLEAVVQSKISTNYLKLRAEEKLKNL